MDVTPAMIEAAARRRAQREGFNPDRPVHYDPAGPYLREPVPDFMIGALSNDGVPIKQWPTMPLWKWKYEAPAADDLRAAFAGLRI